MALSVVDQVEEPTVLSPAPGSPVETTVTHNSLGVVTIIVPFNWPLAILAAALPYALLAGNTVVVKAPPSTPLSVARLVQRLAEKLPAGVLNLISGRDENMSGLMGPLNSANQKDFVNTLIAQAKDAGADVREFGELPGGEFAEGNFVRPAIVVTDDASLRVVAEEQFGPVVPVLAFDTEEEAVALANDTWAGLGASVWTEDTETARRVGSQLVAGYVWVNDYGADRLDLRAPFGGMKSSGMGREQGIEGIRDFQDTHSLAFLDEAAVAQQ